MQALRDAAPAHGVRLLPPNDPFLLAADRDTLVPEHSVRTQLWRATQPPGALLVDGEVVGTWRAHKKGPATEVDVTTWGRTLTKAARAALEDEAGLIGHTRGTPRAHVSVSGRD